MKMEIFHSLAPELIPTNTVEIKSKSKNAPLNEEQTRDINLMSKMSKMPIPMDAFSKPPAPIHRSEPVETLDAAVNTGGDFDVTEEIFKHVGTLRKISMIAEEFNQKTGIHVLGNTGNLRNNYLLLEITQYVSQL